MKGHGLFVFLSPAVHREIRVEAADRDEAAGRMLKAGAMGCRNGDIPNLCEEAVLHLPPMADDQLTDIVRLYMSEEYGMVS